MRQIILLLIIVSFCSCQKAEIIHYSDNGVTITRLNKRDKVFFSYGYLTDEDVIVKEASVAVDYSFDHFLFGFLLFNKNGTVEIIAGGGGQYKNLKEGAKVFYSENSTFVPHGFKQGNYNNLYQLSENVTLEEKRNTAFGSTVRIIK